MPTYSTYSALGSSIQSGEIDNDAIDTDQLAGKFKKNNFVELISSFGGYVINSVAVVSTTRVILSYKNATSLLIATLASGVWTVVTVAHNLTAASRGVVACEGDPTKLISWSETTTSYSADSGATWTVANAELGATKIFDLQFITAALAVSAIQAGAGVHFMRCIDFATGASLNWVQCSTGAAAYSVVINMLDLNDGIAIDSNQNIFNTTLDAADNWTDTTHQSTDIAGNAQCLALTDTTGIIATPANIQHYNNANSYITFDHDFANYYPTNILKSYAGNYYVAFFPHSSIAHASPIILCKSADGIKWDTKVVGIVDNTLTGDDWFGYQLAELDQNILILCIDKFHCIIDER